MGVLIGIEDNTDELAMSEMCNVLDESFSTDIIGRHYGTLDEDVHDKWLQGWIAPSDGNIADYYVWIQYYGQRGIYNHENGCDCLLCTQTYTFGPIEAKAMLDHIETIGPAIETDMRALLESKLRKMTPSKRDWWDKKNQHLDNTANALMRVHQEIMLIRIAHLQFLVKNSDCKLYGAK